METRANYIAVGFFTLVALVAAFVSIYWFGRYGDKNDFIPVDIRIQGSVSGLGPGSQVQFNGINVGRVKGLSLDPEQPQFVIVHTELLSSTPVRQDTRATIGIRGLSGGAFIQLEGGTPDSPSLLQIGDGQSSTIPQIEGDPAALADLLQRVNGIAARVERFVDTIDGLLKANSDSLTQTLVNVETFSNALAKNSDGVSNFMQSAGNVAVSLERLSGQLDGSLKQVEKILLAIDPDKISSTVKNAESFSKTLADQKTQIAALMEDVSKTAGELNSFSQNLSSTMGKVDKVVDAIEAERITSLLANIDKSAERAEQVLASLDQNKITKTIDDISASASGARGIIEGVDKEAIRLLVEDMGNASKSVATLLEAVDAARVNKAVDNISTVAEGAKEIVEDVKKVTSGIGERSSEINQIISDASELTARLNDSSKKIDGVMNQINSLLGSGTANGLVVDVKRTLAEFRKTARNLDSRIAEVTRSISSFTKRGLGDTQGLIQDARQSINRIDRVIRNIQNNPSALISGSGGSRVRETKSARPRR